MLSSNFTCEPQAFLKSSMKTSLKFLLRYNERNVDNIHKNLGTYFIKRRLSFSKNNCDEL